jgi:hypothetical protein
MTFFLTDKLSGTTISMYDTRINKWLDIMPTKSIDAIILFPRKSIQLLVAHLKSREAMEGRDVCTRANLRNYITSIVAVLRYSPHIAPTIPNRIEYHALWTSIIKEVAQPIYDRQIQERPTEKQERRGGSKLAFADLIKKRDSPELSTPSRLLLAMYTYMYPVRADYYATEIVMGDKEPSYPNYLRVSQESSELVLRDFKTARFFPTIHYTRIPNELHLLIAASLQEKPRSFLFESSEGNPYTRTRFSQWASATLAQLFGVELNLTMIRHLFISSLSMDTPLEELQRIGNLMGHSIARQRLYKWREAEEQEESVSGEDSDEEDRTPSS